MVSSLDRLAWIKLSILSPGLCHHPGLTRIAMSGAKTRAKRMLRQACFCRNISVHKNKGPKIKMPVNFVARAHPRKMIKKMIPDTWVRLLQNAQQERNQKVMSGISVAAR